jgi:hypothetical protein
MDIVAVADKEYRLAGKKGVGLFDPRQFGIQPETVSTACYRGYWCHYSCRNDELVLVELSVDARSPLPPLAGIEPRTHEVLKVSHEYRPLELRVLFSGGLVLVANLAFRGDANVTPSPPAHLDVVEARFDNGRLLTIRDCSAAMAAVRDRLRSFEETRPDIAQWTRDDFRAYEAASWSFVDDGYERQPGIR